MEFLPVVTVMVTGQNPSDMYPPDKYPETYTPLDTYPLDIYPLGQIPPPPPDIYPRTYTPHNLKCLIWLMHHVLITYCTLKLFFCRNCIYL